MMNNEDSANNNNTVWNVFIGLFLVVIFIGIVFVFFCIIIYFKCIKGKKLCKNKYTDY